MSGPILGPDAPRNGATVHRLRGAQTGLPPLARDDEDNHPEAVIGYLAVGVVGVAAGVALAHLPGVCTRVCDALLRVLGW